MLNARAIARTVEVLDALECTSGLKYPHVFILSNNQLVRNSIEEDLRAKFSQRFSELGVSLVKYSFRDSLLGIRGRLGILVFIDTGYVYTEQVSAALANSLRSFTQASSLSAEALKIYV